MASDKLMIDSGTGASPPRFSTRDIGCSPIHFGSLTQSTTRSGKYFDSSSIVLNQEQNIRENTVMKKIVDHEQTSSLSLPSSYSSSSSSNTTPVLSSLSTIQPVSLMSLDVNDCYGRFHTAQQSSSTTNSHRWWPVDRKSRFERAAKHRQGGRHLRGGGGVKKQGGGCCQRSTRIRLDDCHYDHHCRTTSCSQYCNLHHHC